MNVEQDVIKAYFESNGFLIRQAGQNIEGLSKKKNGFPTFAVLNPSCQKNGTDLSFRLFTGDMMQIHLALVSLVGWQDTSFSHLFLHSDARLIKFLTKEVVPDRLSVGYNPQPEFAESRMGEFRRLLVVPALPKAENKCIELFASFQEMGVQGIFTLSSVLENLLRKTLSNSMPSNHSVFHLLKMLKAYDLASEPQLDIFKV